MKNTTIRISMDQEKIDALKDRILVGASRGHIHSVEHGVEIFKKELIENLRSYIKMENFTSADEQMNINVTSKDELLDVTDVVMAQLRREARRKPDEPKPDPQPFNAEELLREQMKLAAEASKSGVLPDELCDLSSALCDLYKTLNRF